MYGLQAAVFGYVVHFRRLTECTVLSRPCFVLTERHAQLLSSVIILADLEMYQASHMDK